ncbi:P2X purinoceptor 7-like [Dreissena polymorpha]|nr:P2X purinoceptor 7-like [Dreissena polymorpha]
MAFTLSANDVTRLQLTHQQKKEQCDALVDRLTGEEAKDLLKEISKKMPFLVLDVADKLQAGPHSTPPRGDFPDWCICTRCRPMETVQQHVCCGMRPELCHSINAEMRLMILDAGVLRTQMLYRNDVFARHAASEKDVNKSYRHAGYRQYILIHHGRLGLGVRRPVPSCCTWAIRGTFPDPDGFYVPYEPSW